MNISLLHAWVKEECIEGFGDKDKNKETIRKKNQALLGR
jgi:hypothetical protein